MIHEILPVGPLQCNCSVFGDEQTREALVVDPGDEIGRVLAIIAEHGLAVKAIVITHAHIDHIGGAQKLKQATGAPVYMNPDDEELQEMLEAQAAWLGVAPPQPVTIDSAAKDGDRLVVGATEFHVLHTPGHTPGSITLHRDGVVFSGDALLSDAEGHESPPRKAMSGDWEQAQRSADKIRALGYRVLLTGHGEPVVVDRA
jgi:hydroxyacylglutathione hydrolase